MNSFYSIDELVKIGIKKLGNNVLISRKASIYGAENIEIGDNVRIDDFCILSGNIKIGNYVHIAAYCGMFGGDAGIFLDDFSGLSSRTVVYAASDDYSGEFLTNPTVDDKYRNVICKPVKVGKHVVVGTGSTILPGVNIGDGSSVGACSLIVKDCEENSIYVGVPAKKLKERSKRVFELEKDFLLNKE